MLSAITVGFERLWRKLTRKTREERGAFWGLWLFTISCKEKTTEGSEYPEIHSTPNDLAGPPRESFSSHDIHVNNEIKKESHQNDTWGRSQAPAFLCEICKEAGRCLQLAHRKVKSKDEEPGKVWAALGYKKTALWNVESVRKAHIFSEIMPHEAKFCKYLFALLSQEKRGGKTWAL